MSAIITVLYPAEDTPGAFNLDYYLNKHMPLCQKEWGSMGLTSYKVIKVSSDGDGNKASPFLQTLLEFESLDAWQVAAEAKGKLLADDVRNFYGKSPVFLVGEVLGSG